MKTLANKVKSRNIFDSPFHPVILYKMCTMLLFQKRLMWVLLLQQFITYSNKDLSAGVLLAIIIRLVITCTLASYNYHRMIDNIVKHMFGKLNKSYYIIAIIIVEAIIVLLNILPDYYTLPLIIKVFGLEGLLC